MKGLKGLKDQFNFNLLIGSDKMITPCKKADHPLQRKTTLLT